MRNPLLIALAVFSLFQFIFTSQTDAQTVRYVKAGASGDGSAWATASGDLQAMINKSLANDIIWVAEGTYLPNRRADALTVITPNDRNNAFVLKKDVKIYGSFAGSETSLTQRDLTQTANASILSGDLGTVNDNSDNAYHVVIGAGNVGAAELNGFTIKDGNANNSGNMITVNSAMIYGHFGAGFYNESSSPRLTNVIISGNSAISAAGGIFNLGSSPVLTNVIISGNIADYGGGIYNNSSSPVLTNVTVSGNNASTIGGGMYNIIGSNPKIRNCIIYGNNNEIINNASSPVVEYSLVLGSSSTANGNIDGTIANPLFVSQLAPGLNTGGDYRLQNGSPLIGKGNIVYFDAGQTPDLSAITTDVDGNPRKRGVTIDLGAYENQTSVLPITLTGFSVKAEGSLAKLEWATATEMNNKEFIVSRSTDGVRFNEIGKVQGAGNSFIKNSYIFYDNHPAGGINYYRLQQKDFDGKITSHGIRMVQFSLPEDVVKIYPNPVKTFFKVECNAGLYEQIELIDNNGKVLQRVSLTSIEKEKTLRIGNYPAGAYFVRLKGNGKEQVEKIMKE